MSQGVFIPDLGRLHFAPRHWQACHGSARFAHSLLSASGPPMVLIWAYGSFSLCDQHNDLGEGGPWWGCQRMHQRKFNTASRVFQPPLTVNASTTMAYNLVAEHGLHPRWLHLVVNLPMIATPALLYYVLRAELDIFASRSGDRNKSKPGIVQMMQHSRSLRPRC